MIRPASFGYNAETAANNVFKIYRGRKITAYKKKKQLQNLIGLLKRSTKKNIEVLVIQDTPSPPKPDAVFPNNWFCTLSDGTIAVFQCMPQTGV